MSGFVVVTLRWYHDRALNVSGGTLVYVGGELIEYLDIDVDRISYFELIGYIK